MSANPFTVGEIEDLMGAPMPPLDTQRAAALAYAEIALGRIYAKDEARASDTFLLQCAPRDLLRAWDAIVAEETRRRGASHPRE